MKQVCIATIFPFRRLILERSLEVPPNPLVLQTRKQGLVMYKLLMITQLTIALPETTTQIYALSTSVAFLGHFL